MKKLRALRNTLFLCFIATITSLAQFSDPKLNLNLLRGPVSPAANLLGISPSDVQRPTDLPAFMVSAQNSTNNFSTIPDNIAVDITPFWLFGKKGEKVSFSDFNSNKNSLIQTLTISSSIRNWKSKSNIDSTSQLGFGFRFSLFRGSFVDNDLDELFEALKGQQTIFNDELTKLETAHARYAKVQVEIARLDKISDKSDSEKSERNSLINEAQQITSTLKIEADKKTQERIEREKKLIENKPLQRSGFKLDFAGGLAWDFEGSKFSNGKMFKSGTWLTGGYQVNDGQAFFAVWRILFNPDKTIVEPQGTLSKTDITTFDTGFQYSYQKPGSAFSLSTEFIYRSIINNNTVPSTYRWTSNLNYIFAKNTVITLALGKDFDNTFKNDGNFIGLINLIKGFGSQRTLE
ncbi:hypothetical protein [Siphonobacter sp. SORGH_AS_1065]|uniref:hypothetical protein n=1 Tax=Siphonobacter sp. SORGH_AS_1065 TaxID=3041795 RepID=UPI002788E508|nr:hypothetical protein [Siphonobacter sp. SORGH_AS_1065]MDQ1089296.1 hypothetical protein [Siphonobacter sp. SORGH_AS_1065]